MDKAIERNDLGPSHSGNTSLFQHRAFLKMVINGKAFFLVSTKFKHV